MANGEQLLFQSTPSLILPIETNVPRPELGTETIEEFEEKQRQEWLKAREKRIEEVYQQYVENAKKAGVNIKYKTYEELRKASQESIAFDPRWDPTGQRYDRWEKRWQSADIDPEAAAQYTKSDLAAVEKAYQSPNEPLNEFVQFYRDQERIRVGLLKERAPDAYMAELKWGGSDITTSVLEGVRRQNPRLSAFMSGMFKPLTLSVYSGWNDIYGDDLNNYYSQYHAAGNILGEFLSIVAMAGTMRAATTAGAALVGKSAKLSRALKNANQLQTFFARLGTPSALLHNGIKGWRAVDTGSKILHGVTATQAAFTFGFKDYLNTKIRNVLHADSLPKDQFNEPMKANPWLGFGAGMLKGFGLNIANASTRLLVRTAFDAVWGMGLQLDNIASGRGFDTQQLFYDMALGFVLGERDIWMTRALGLTRQGLKALTPGLKSQVQRSNYIYKQIKADATVRGADEWETQNTAAVVAAAEMSRRTKGLPEFKDWEIKTQALSWNKNAQEPYRLAMRRGRFRDMIEVSLKDLPIGEKLDFVRASVQEAVRATGLNMGDINDPKQLHQFLKKNKIFNKVLADVPQKGVKGISTENFYTELDKLIANSVSDVDSIRTLQKAGYLEGLTSVSRLKASVDEPSELTRHNWYNLDPYNLSHKRNVSRARVELSEAEALPVRDIKPRIGEKLGEEYVIGDDGVGSSPLIKAAIEEVVAQRDLEGVLGKSKGERVRARADLHDRVVERLMELSDTAKDTHDHVIHGAIIKARESGVTEDPVPSKKLMAALKRWNDKSIANVEARTFRGPEINALPGQALTIDALPADRAAETRMFSRVRKMALKEGFTEEGFLRLARSITSPGLEEPSAAPIDQVMAQLRKWAATGVVLDRVKEFNESGGQILSLDAPVSREGVTPEGDLLSSEKLAEMPADDRVRMMADTEMKLNKVRERAEKGERRAPSSINMADIENRDLAIMAQIAKNDPRNIVNVLARYWHDKFGIERSDIQRHLAAYGINLTEQQITNRINLVRPGVNPSNAWKKAEVQLLGGARAAKVEQERPYTVEEVRRIWDEASEKADRINDQTGLESDIDDYAFERSTESVGAFVINIDPWVQKMRVLYGDARAAHMRRAVAEFINKKVVAQNKRFEGKREETKYILRNPEDNNSADFVLTGTGMSKKQLQDVAFRIYNLLDGKRPDNARGEYDAFAISMGEELFTRVDDMVFSFTRQIEDIPTISENHLSVRNLVINRNPNVEEKVTRMMLNADDPKVRDAVVGIMSDAERASAAELKRRTKNMVNGSVMVPEGKSASREADDFVEDQVILGTEALKVIQMERNLVRNPGDPTDATQEIVKHRLADEDVVGLHQAARKTAEIADTMFENRVTQVRSEDESLGARLLTRASRLTKQFSDWQKGALTVYEDDARYVRAQRAIQKLNHETGDVSTKVTEDAILEADAPLISKYFAGSQELETKGYIYKNMMLLMREKEWGRLFEGKRITSERIMPEWLVKLTEPITDAESIQPTLDRWLLQGEKVTNGDILNLRHQSSDPLVLSKIAVQHLGVEPKDLAEHAVRDHKLVWEFFRDMQERTGGFEGSYVEGMVWDSLSRKLVKNINKFLQRYGRFTEPVVASSSDAPPPKMAPDSFEAILHNNRGRLVPTLQEILKQMDVIRTRMISESPGGPLSDKFLTDQKIIAHALNEAILLDKKVTLYTTHRVLENLENVKMALGNLNKRIVTGKGPLGNSRLSSSIFDTKNRVFSTMEGVMSAGYKVETDAIKVRQAMLKYGINQLRNWELAEGIRGSTFNRGIALMKPVRDATKEFNKLVGKSKTFPAAQRFQLLNSAADKIAAMAPRAIEEFTNHGGLFYRPNSEDDKIWMSKIRVMEDRIEVTDPKNTVEIERLRAEIDKVRGFQKWAFGLRQILTANVFYRAKWKVYNEFKGNAEVGMDVAGADAMKRQIVADREFVRNQIDEQLRGGKEEVALPLRAKTHSDDAGNKKYYEGQSRMYDPSFWPTTYKRNHLDKMEINGFQGIYATRPVAKGIKQFILRTNVEDTQESYTAAQKVIKLYDKLNLTMRNFSFIKPTIVWSNEIGQTAMATDLIDPRYWSALKFAATAVKNQNAATGAMIKNPNPDASPEEFFWALSETGVLHKGFGSTKHLVDDSTKIWGRMLKKNLLQRAGMAWAEGGVLNGAVDKAMRTFGSYQSLTWAGDNILRTALAKRFYDMVMPIELKKANGNRSVAQKRAMWVAAERTNLFSADYSRVPFWTSRVMNRVAFVPAFKMQTARLAKEIWKEFGQGLQILSGTRDVGDVKFHISESRVRQAAFMMAPTIRKAFKTAAVRVILAGALGLRGDGLMNDLFGYTVERLEEKDPDDPLSSYVRKLSLSTPFFQMEKWITRDWSLFLRYNSSAMLGLVWSLASNRDKVTGQRIADPTDNPLWYSAKHGLYTLTHLFPGGSLVRDMNRNDQELWAKIFNASGLGYIYRTDSPREVLNDYLTMVDESRTVGERERATNQFTRKMDRISNMLFQKKYSGIYQLILDEKQRAAEREL